MANDLWEHNGMGDRDGANESRGGRVRAKGAIVAFVYILFLCRPMSCSCRR